MAVVVIIVWLGVTSDAAVTRFVPKLAFAFVEATVVFCPCVLEMLAAISSRVKNTEGVICKRKKIHIKAIHLLVITSTVSSYVQVDIF